MANNTLIGAIRAEATLESGKFVDGAKKIRLESQKTEAAVKSSFSGMGAAIKGFGGAISAGLSIGLLTGLASKAIDYARSIGVVAKQLGVTTTELQTFRYAAQQVGVTVPEADKALERLGVSISKAIAGSKPAIAAFDAVGVKLQDLKSKSETQIFSQIADQMNKQGGAAKNAAAGAALMGEGFNKLAPLLDKGSAGINELSQAAQRLGIVLSDQQIQNADETARKLNDVKMVLAAQISGVVADNAQSIASLAGALAKLTSAVVGFLGSNPQLALAIIGGLAGSRFGLPGAATGAVLGAVAGGKLEQNMADANTDRKFRAAEIRKALKKYRDAKSGASDPTGKLGANPAAIGAARKELERQIGLGLKANSLPRAGPAAGNAPIPQFLAGGGGGGGRTRKARAPRVPRDRSDDVAYQSEQELRRAQIDTLQAQRGMSDDYVERRNISIQILDLQKQEREAELNNRVRLAERDLADGKITAGTVEQVKVQADQLRLEYDKQHNLEVQAANEEEQAHRREEVAKLEDLDYDLGRQKLENEAALADTAKEQRDIALKLLDYDYRYEKAKLDKIMAEEEIGSLAWEEARRRKAALDEIYAGRRAAAKAGTRGPLEDFGSSLPLDADKLNEALENVAVDGLKSLEDGLMDVISGTKSVKEAFHDMAAAILADLIRIAIQKYVIGTIMQVAGLGGTGGGMADGGLVPGFASGGFVSGPGGPREDRVPAMLSAGEFVVNAASTRKFLPFLHALNEGNVQHRKSGGGIFSAMFGGSFGSLALGLSGGMFGKASSGLSALPFGAVGKIFGFADGGLVPKTLPIAQASYGPRVSATQNNVSVTPIALTFHNDFRGADPSAVASIQAKLNRMEAEFPGKVVATMQDAKDRFVWRGDRR